MNKCKNCAEPIHYHVAGAWKGWVHASGRKFCHIARNFTKTPLLKAEPVLETEVL